MLLHDCANIIILHTAQNQWLRQNVLDAHGNLLFCRNCITSILDVQSERLHKQRLIKQQLNQKPVVHMTKAVTDERLQNYILHSDETQNFATWWKTVDDGDDVEVQFPHEHHGLLVGSPTTPNRMSWLISWGSLMLTRSQMVTKQEVTVPSFLHPKFTRIAPP